MKIKKGHKDILELILYGTGQDSIASAKTYLDTENLWSEFVHALNNPQLWSINTMATRSDAEELLDHYSSVTIADVQ